MVQVVADISFSCVCVRVTSTSLASAQTNNPMIHLCVCSWSSKVMKRSVVRDCMVFRVRMLPEGKREREMGYEWTVV